MDPLKGAEMVRGLGGVKGIERADGVKGEWGVVVLGWRGLRGRREWSGGGG